MWANTTLSSCRLQPLTTVTATTTTTTGRSNHRPFIVSAKHQRPQKNIKYDSEDEEIETDRELELLKQREIEEPNAYAATSEKISGSAVLLAMQKASAQKSSKKMKNKKKSRNVNDDEDNRRKQGDAIVDYGDVKPLCIKSDWKDRLDDLEKQLHELIHHA